MDIMYRRRFRFNKRFKILLKSLRRFRLRVPSNDGRCTGNERENSAIDSTWCKYERCVETKERYLGPRWRVLNFQLLYL